MSIECVEVYRTMGKDFPTEKAAQDFRRDQIGLYLDPIMNAVNLSSGHKIKLVEFIAENRDKLAALLDY